MRMLTTALVLAFLSAPALAQDNPLDIFAPLMGTWVGESTDPETPNTQDVMKFEWILGGAAVQHTHSIDGGVYGGRTIYFWDGNENDGAGGVIYHYFTTAGFHTQGTAWWEDGRLVAQEDVHGLEDITKVRGYIVPSDEGWDSSADYLTNGEWVSGHGFAYVAATEEVVAFGEE